MPCDVLMMVGVADVLLHIVISLVSQPRQLLFLIMTTVMILIIDAFVIDHGERFFTAIATPYLIFMLHLTETGHSVHLLLRLVV